MNVFCRPRKLVRNVHSRPASVPDARQPSKLQDEVQFLGGVLDVRSYSSLECGGSCTRLCEGRGPGSIPGKDACCSAVTRFVDTFDPWTNDADLKNCGAIDVEVLMRLPFRTGPGRPTSWTGSCHGRGEARLSRVRRRAGG